MSTKHNKKQNIPRNLAPTKFWTKFNLLGDGMNETLHIPSKRVNLIDPTEFLSITFARVIFRVLQS